jgi:hypothetical protein
VRLDGITAAQRRLRAELTGRISIRLAVECEKRLRPESLNVGVTLEERGTHGRLDISRMLLQEAKSDRTARTTAVSPRLSEPRVARGRDTLRRTSGPWSPWRAGIGAGPTASRTRARQIGWDADFLRCRIAQGQVSST